MVVIEARLAGLQQLHDLGVAARRAEIAPAIDYVHLGGITRGIRFQDAERAAVRPVGRLELPRPAQLPVEHRVELPDQACLAQQRAELARGALPFDAPYLACQPGCF